ncbi:HNH endonuclease [Streptomyces sp. TN58]|uniref:HNH endonuclease signature motif containing protein n=1 Tax=Streptomyces sp. TN58 TaxID=234612 RepID=UPI00095051C1|nr:HNH endonuclease [Streptomyces sp. TN58]APU40446.1 HNH endonuclease [Streptomyces sp. TN58]
MGDPYERESLAVAIAASTGWADLIRRLGLQVSGGRRRALQLAAERHGIDTRHFARHDSRRTYSDEAIASAAASSFTVREVALELGARPSTGTLSHLVRRIAAAGIDISHFRGLRRERVELPFTTQELTVAAASSDSIRATGRALGMPDDGRARAALARALKAHSIDTTHFRNSRLAIAEADLRAVVPHATSHADVMRALGIEVNDVNHRRVRRRIAQLDVDVSHFTRRPWSRTPAAAVKDMAADTLVLSPAGSPRTKRSRLHRALQEIGVPYACTSCGNPGEWQGQPITLQIDHVNGDWLDNRCENLRYLCPNCHAQTDTWCRKRPPRADSRSGRP